MVVFAKRSSKEVETDSGEMESGIVGNHTRNIRGCGHHGRSDQQFCYPAQMRNADVIQLTEASLSAEPTIIDKLRAITEDRGATKDEVIAVQQKIIALMREEAAKSRGSPARPGSNAHSLNSKP
jgi:hypothetical protein